MPISTVLTIGWLVGIGLAFLVGLLCLELPLYLLRSRSVRVLRKIAIVSRNFAGESMSEGRAQAIETMRPWSSLHQAGVEYRRAWDAARLERHDIAVGDLAFEDFANPTSLLPSFANRRLANALPGILVALGILGTFAGLVISLPNLGFGVRATELQFDQLMGSVLGGLRLAFMTSIAGISGSVVFLFVDRWQVNAVERHIVALSGALHAMFPTMSPAEAARRQYEIADDIAQNVRTVGTDLATTLVESVTPAMERAIASQMGPLADSMRESVERLERFASEGQVRGVEGLVKNFMTEMSSAMGGQFEELRGVLESTVESQQLVESGISTFGDQLKQSAEIQERLISQTIRAAEALSGSLDRLEAISGLLHDAAEDVLKAGAQLEISAEAATKSQQAALEAQERLLEASDRHAEVMAEARDQLSQSWREAVDQARGAIHLIQEATRELSEGVGDQLVGALDRFDGTLAETLERFSGTLVQVDGSIGELPGNLVEIRNNSEALREASVQLVAGTGNLEGIVKELNNGHLGSAAQASRELRLEMTSLKEVITQFDAGLDRLRTTIAEAGTRRRLFG